jgi:hypothetical protein
MEMKRTFTIFLAGTIFLFTACSKKNDTTTNNSVGTTTNTPSVSTFAGSGIPGAIDGTKEQAEFNYPTGISISNEGYFFVADRQNDLARLITPLGVVSTLAGTAGMPGFNNKADSTLLFFPSGTSADAAGNVYIADNGNGVIREVTTTGVVSTYAGNVSGATFSTKALSAPFGVATDPAGDVFVADIGNNTIVKITPKGAITTVAGSGTSGSVNGTGTSASFNYPSGLVVDGVGNIYVADRGNNEIRLINTQGQVSTFAGGVTAGSANGKGTAASFNGPAGICMDSSGNLYVADSNNNMIREIATDGTVTTFAGTGQAGATNGSPLASTFNNPQGVAVDPYFRVFVCDTGNSLIRLIQQ